MIAPIKIKKPSHSDWAPFCQNSKYCKRAQKLLKSKIREARGYNKKNAKIGESFAELYPDLANMRHKTCPLDLFTYKYGSNDIAIFACNNCGQPVKYKLSEANKQTELYCKTKKKCKEKKAFYEMKRKWSTRERNKQGNFYFSDVNPKWLSDEWQYCTSHPHHNLGPGNVPAHSKEVLVQWQCSSNPDHIWEKNCDHRTNFKGCPFCNSNISNTQLRFACELEKLLKRKVAHSKIFIMDGIRTEIDISFRFKNQKIAIEVDGYGPHIDKAMHDKKKIKRIINNGWKTINIRDERLKKLKIIPDSDIFHFKPSEFYKQNWLDVISDIVKFISGFRPRKYTNFIAEDKYQSLKKFYNKPKK